MVLSVSRFPLPVPPPYYTRVAVIHFSSFTLASQVFWTVEGRLEWSSGFECICYFSPLAMEQLAAASSLQILISLVSSSSLAKWTSEGFWENEMQQCMYKAKCDDTYLLVQHSEHRGIMTSNVILNCTARLCLKNTKYKNVSHCSDQCQHFMNDNLNLYPPYLPVFVYYCFMPFETVHIP